MYDSMRARFTSLEELTQLTTFTDSDEEREHFRLHPDKLMDHIKQMETGFNGRWDHNIVGNPEQLAIKDMVAKRMKSMIKDEKLAERMTPTFPVNCRR